MDINTSSLIFLKLADSTLTRILSLSKCFRPNDLFWSKRFEQRYGVDLKEYAKMSYYHIYRELITAEQPSYYESKVCDRSFYDKTKFGKEGWLHKTIIERGYRPLIYHIFNGDGSRFIRNLRMNRKQNPGSGLWTKQYIGPLISAARFGHLELVEYFLEKPFLKPSNYFDTSGMTDALKISIKFGHTPIFYYLFNHRNMTYNQKNILNFDRLSYPLLKVLKPSIKYLRYEIFEHLYNTWITIAGRRRTYDCLWENIDDWIIQLAIKYDHLEFVKYLIDKLKLQPSIEFLLILLLKHGTAKQITLPLFTFLYELIPKTHFQTMVDNIVNGRNPTLSRPFLALFKLFNGNPNIYCYLLTRYPHLPLYFLRKIIRYCCHQYHVLEVLFELYPGLFREYESLRAGCKGVTNSKLQTFF